MSQELRNTPYFPYTSKLGRTVYSGKEYRGGKGLQLVGIRLIALQLAENGPASILHGFLVAVYFAVYFCYQGGGLLPILLMT
jgi:hypothetical protein